MQYTGEVDSHPYAVASLGDGSWAVADAGGNDILRVEPNGNVFTLAVLPNQPFKVTAEFAKENQLPKCTVGVTYRDEAVPTDVEVGPNGSLYVSTLPGGVGALGSVYKLSDRAYNTAHLVATGIPSATNLAVDKAGNIYVASLFAGLVFEVAPARRPHRCCRCRVSPPSSTRTGTSTRRRLRPRSVTATARRRRVRSSCSVADPATPEQ